MAMYMCLGLSTKSEITFSLFNTIYFNSFVLLRLTDEGSVPEMRIWSILLINPN